MDLDSLKRDLPSVDRIAADLYGLQFTKGAARCPFPGNHTHGDRDPSLRYDRKKNRIFDPAQNCFGENGVDAFGLVQRMEGVEFVQAAEKLAAHYAPHLLNGSARNGSSPQQVNQQAQRKPRGAAEVREKVAADGYDFVADYYFEANRRKVEARHRTRMQPDKGRPDKTYLWEHQSATGEWLSGKGDFGPLPVYVNEVFAERESPGFTLGLEGEGKADAAGRMGLPAFSYREGDDFSRLAGWRVALWADKDEAGAKTVERAIEKLSPHTKEILIIEPPAELPPKGDIVDAVEKLGWGRAEIDALISAARAVPLSPQPIRSVEDLPSPWDCGGDVIEWTVEGMLAEATVCMLAGGSGDGKTTLAWGIGRDVSRGAKFSGRATTKRWVLILDRENPLTVTLERLARLGITRDDQIKVWGGWLRDEVPAPDSPLVLDWIQAHSPKPLVIVDSLIRFNKGSENDAADTNALMSSLRRLADAGATVIALHHSGKAESAKEYRGSSDMKAAIDIGYTLKNLGGDRLGRLVLRAFKSRYLVPSEILLDYADGAFIGESRPAVTTVSDRLRDLLIEHSGVLTRDFEDIAKANGIGRNQARRWRDDNLAAGNIEIRSTDNRSQRLYWTGGSDRGAR